MRKVLFSLFLILIAGTGGFEARGEGMMKISSPDFTHEGDIPAQFTCQGADISPEIRIEGVPQGAKSLALVVDDPDAPVGTWTHWVVFNIDPATRVIPRQTVPGIQGWNDFGRMDWGGPCPPRGVHRYFFRLYALDEGLGLRPGVKRGELEAAMEGHILAEAMIMGRYKKF